MRTSPGLGGFIQKSRWTPPITGSVEVAGIVSHQRSAPRSGRHYHIANVETGPERWSDLAQAPELVNDSEGSRPPIS